MNDRKDEPPALGFRSYGTKKESLNIEQIQSLLMIQDLDTPGRRQLWHQKCKTLLQEWKSYRLKQHILDVSKWVGDRRPEWSQRFPYSDRYGYANSIYMKFEPSTNPVFALLALNLYLRNDYFFYNEMTSKLLDLLMECGCNRPDILNQSDVCGITPIMVAMLSQTMRSVFVKTRGVCLTPRMPVMNRMPCWSLMDLCYACPWDNRDSVLIFLWDRWSTESRKSYLLQHMWLTMYMNDHIMMSNVWHFFINRIKSVDLLRPFQEIRSKSSRNLLAVAAGNSDSYAWELLTRCHEVSSILTSHPALGNYDTDSSYESSALTEACANSSPDADFRGAWLVHRIDKSHLNRYSLGGSPPLLAALQFDKKETIHAMVSRIDEIDLFAPAFYTKHANLRFNPSLFVGQELSANFEALEEFLEDPNIYVSPALDSPVSVDAGLIRWRQDLDTIAHTLGNQKKQMGFVIQKVYPFLICFAGFPKEIVHICFTYGRFPSPACTDIENNLRFWKPQQEVILQQKLRAAKQRVINAMKTKTENENLNKKQKYHKRPNPKVPKFFH